MRIKSLDIKAFGPFTGNKVEFSASPGVIDVLSGLNEAGKTSLLRSISGLLFGIPHNTGDSFLHPMRSLKIGAELQSADGEWVTLYRRKGNQNTLLDASDSPVDEAILRAILGDIDRRTYEMMFGLDHDHLRAGGMEILAGRGDAGMSLLQAGAGIAGLRKVLAELESEAGTLFRPKGSNQVINAALGRLRCLRQQARDESLSSDRWVELTREYGEVEAKLIEATRGLRDLQTERATLDRVRRILPLAARRAELVSELGGLRDAPDLREDATDERVETLKRIALAEQRRDRARDQVSQLSPELEGICIDQAVLDHADQIEELAAERALMQKNAQDLGKRETEEREHVRQAEAILNAAGIDTPIDKAYVLIPPKPVLTAVRTLIKEHASLSTRCAAAEDEVKKIDARLAHDRTALAAGAGPTDASVLEAAVAEVAKAGPLERNLSELKAQCERDRSALNRMLSALGLFQGSVAELESLPVPPATAIDRFAATFREHRDRLGGARRKIEEVDERIQQRQRNLETLRRGGQVATEDDLVQSRSRRDSGWRLIRRAYIDSNDDVSSEAATFAPGALLPDAYQSAVSAADQTADVLRMASTRAAQIATLEQDLKNDRKTRGQQAEKIAQLEADGARLDAQWRQLWEPAGIGPLEPPEMAEWLRKRADLLARSTVLGATEDSVSGREGEIARCHRRLAVALITVGEPSAHNDETLAALLARAETALKRLGKAHSERAALEASVRSAETDLDVRNREHKTARQNLSQWRIEWAKALKALLRDVDTAPAAIETLLSEFESLREVLNRLAGVRRQISGINNDITRYRTRVEEIVDAAAPECTGLDALEAVRQMTAMLNDAHKAIERRDGLARLIEAAHGEAEKTERALDDERVILDRLCHEAGCVSPDQLPAAEQRAARKHALTERLEEAERQMLDGGDGKSLVDLVAEAQGRKLEDVVGRVSEIDAALELLNQDSTDLGARRATLSGELDVLNQGSASAAQAAQEAEIEAALLAAEAARYVKVRVAAGLLAGAIERYRKRNQGPILGRASQIFERLTAGSFATLEVELDEGDVPVVIGVRPGGATVPVEGMSNGTRDQLFLALRIAAIEQYVAAKGPMVFIADDLLVDFDDQRAAAALEVLSELSECTQVLFFTHHVHIVELAKRVLGPNRVEIHELANQAAHVSDKHNPAAAASSDGNGQAVAPQL